MCETRGRTGTLFNDLVERAKLTMWEGERAWGTCWSILEQSRGLGSGAERSVGDMSRRMREAERVGADAGGGGCAPVNLEALLRAWIAFGEWGTRSAAESERGGGRAVA